MIRFQMSNLRAHTAASNRRFVWLLWLLWLLLLLPVAQTAATIHVYTHGFAEDAKETRELSDKLALSHAHCGICLSAAALICGAPPAEPPALFHSTALYEVPNSKSRNAWVSPFFPAYEGRAPPLALR